MDIIIETVEAGVRLTLRGYDGGTATTLDRKKAELVAQAIMAAASVKLHVTIGGGA